MGIFLVLVGALLGMVSFLWFIMAQAVTGQLFAGEVAICAAVSFGAGGIILSVDAMRKALDPKPPVPETERKVYGERTS